MTNQQLLALIFIFFSYIMQFYIYSTISKILGNSKADNEAGLHNHKGNLSKIINQVKWRRKNDQNWFKIINKQINNQRSRKQAMPIT